MEINRRQFVGIVAGACAGCLCGQRVLRAEPVEAGDIAQFAKDGIYDQFAEEHLFFLIRRRDRIYALTGMCSHKGHTLMRDPDKADQFKCDKHGSLFTLDGSALKGPAKQPLLRLGIRLDGSRRIVVDPTEQFEKSEWNKEGAFIKV
jgi:Rieske Fe-S protein